MPEKKTKTNSKRTYHKSGWKKRQTQKTTTLFRGTIVSPRFVTKLQYNALTQSVSLVNGGSADAQFRMNSLFDPDYTATGHQPLGFDQLANFYTRYRVYSCAWEVEIPPDIVYDASWVCCVPTNSLTSLGSSFDTAKEQPRSVYKAISTTERTVVRGNTDLANLGGVTKTQYIADDRFQAAVSTDPVELYHLHVVFYNGSGVTVTIPYNIKMIYTCELFDPTQLSQS